MYIFLTAVAVILIIIFIFGVNKKEFYKLKRNLEFAFSLPGASIFLSVVNSLQIALNYKELLDCVDAITKKYGNITRFILGTNVFVVLSKPEDYRLVLTNVNGTYKRSVTKTWEVIIGDGIIRTSGATHKLRRKIIHPLLNLKYLSEYVTFFDNFSHLCADAIEKNVDGPMFDFKPHIMQYSFDIFLASVVGIQETAYKDGYEQVHLQMKLLEHSYSRAIKPWLQLEWIFSLTENGKETYTAQKIMLDFIYNISPGKAANRTASQYNNNYNVTDHFQEIKSIFKNYWDYVARNDVAKSCAVSEENFLDDLSSFFSAIVNTVTEMTSFTVLMLATHIDVQEKLRQEISATFNNDKVDAQRLFGMQYFHMVFQKTLRLFPISPTIMRQLTGDIELESCTLPEGCYIMIPIFTIHRNPAYWPKPLEFIPERFSAENSSSRFRYTYIPFGTGLRDCIGQRYILLSVATIVVNLIRRFQFVTTGSVDDIKVTADFLFRARDVKMSISRVSY